MKERRAACASLQSEIVLCLPVRYATAVKLAPVNDKSAVALPRHHGPPRRARAPETAAGTRECTPGAEPENVGESAASSSDPWFKGRIAISSSHTL
jgi:hypothetical protein